MPAAGPNTTQVERLARIEAQLAGTNANIESLTREVRALAASINDDLCELRKRFEDARAQAIGQAAELAHMKAQAIEHERRLGEVEKLMPTIRLIMWVGAAIGASVIALIWALITGQAALTFH